MTQQKIIAAEPPPTPNTEEGSIHTIRILGEGSFAEVSLIQQKTDRGPIYYAVKAPKLDNDYAFEREARFNEYLQENHIDFRHIIQMITTTNVPRLELVFEYIPGLNLYEAIVEQMAQNGGSHAFSPQETADLMLQVAKGLRAIHSANVLHLDLKPENIMLTVQDQWPSDLNVSTIKKWIRENTGQLLVKIGDFGLSLQSGHDSSFIDIREIASRYYRAPEADGSAWPDKKFDVWSLGCITIETHIGVPAVPTRNFKYFHTMWKCRIEGQPLPENKRSEIQMDEISRQVSAIEISRNKGEELRGLSSRVKSRLAQFQPLDQSHNDPTIWETFRQIAVIDPRRRPSVDDAIDILQDLSGAHRRRGALN